MKIELFDKNHNFIRMADIDDWSEGEYRRISVVFVYDHYDRLLIAKRSRFMFSDPGRWGPSAAGTIEPGETPEQNAVKELEEEVGLEHIKLSFIESHTYVLPSGAGRIAYIYTGKMDKQQPIRTDPHEVDGYQWIEVLELKKQLEKNPDSFVKSEYVWNLAINAKLEENK